MLPRTRSQTLLTREVNLLLLLLVEVLLGKGIETGRHDGEWRGQRKGLADARMRGLVSLSLLLLTLALGQKRAIPVCG